MNRFASETEDVLLKEAVRESIALPYGVLTLLRDTQMFGPMLEKAIDDLDALTKKLKEE